MRPTSIVTVDTEEEGLWGGAYRTDGNTVENILHIPRFQRLCEKFEVRPTYLVDAPVVTDARAVELLAEIHDRGRCEVGSHLHPWCNPPLKQISSPAESYMLNLPVQQQRAKLAWLTEQVAEKFGRRPTSFRAGRYGLDARGLDLLREMGYVVDSSVIPFTDYSPQGGPDFSRAPFTPYFPDHDDLSGSIAEGDVLEVPVTVGYRRGPFRRGYEIQQRVSKGIMARFHLEGVLDRTGLVSRIKMSPEQSSAADMKRLVDRCCELRVPSIVLMFHSSSLLPGASPYVADERALVRFLRTLEEVFEHAVIRRGIPTATLTSFAIDFQGTTGARPKGARGPQATPVEATTDVHHS